MATVGNVAAALLGSFDHVVSRTMDYPGWAKAVFLVTLVLALVSVFVYARGFAEAERCRRAAEPKS